jgi:hypothetical protein
MNKINILFFFIFLLTFLIYLFNIEKYVEKFNISDNKTKILLFDEFIKDGNNISCDKDGIYKILLNIEKRLDKLDYDNYVENKEKTNNDTNQQIIHSTAKSSLNNAKSQMNTLIQNQNNKLINDLNNTNLNNTNSDIQMKKNLKKNKQTKKKNLNNFKNVVNANSNKGFNINLTGNNKNPSVKILSKMLNNVSNISGKNQHKNWNNTLSKINMPSGYVL